MKSTEVDNSPPAIWLGPLNPPPEKSFITLSHAISWIAFRHSISGPQLAMALGIGKVRDASQAITDAEKDDAIAHAVERLTDLGSAGAIEFWARQFRDVLETRFSLSQYVLSGLRIIGGLTPLTTPCIAA